MKKINVLLSLSLIAITSVVFTGLAINATEAEPSDGSGTLKLTFVRNQAKDEDIAFYNWDRGKDAAAPIVKTNGIFTTAEFEVMSDAPDKMGVIPTVADAAGNPTDNKLSFGNANLSVDISDIKDGGVKHAFIFENAKDGEVVYSSTDEDNHLMFVTYYAPSYEDNLGFHSWNMISEHNATAWGTPLQLFKTIGRAPDGTEVKGAVLEASSTTGAGCLVYAGADDNKKHSGDLVFGEDSVPGVPKFVGVANSTVYDATEGNAFVDDAFKLKFVNFGVASNGSYVGTYAVNSESAIGSLSTTIVIPKVKVEADEENDVKEVLYTEKERINLAIEMFSIYETDTPANKVEISTVDFDKNADSVKDFVFTLETELELGTSYTISFNDGVKECSIELNMDQEAPVITLLRSNGVVEVPWGQPFDMKLFPQYEASDDRDGDITAKVFVPKGLGYLDTGVEGDYEVTLRVIDAWGNQTDKVITFRVKK